jgi:hypothetical protein
MQPLEKNARQIDFTESENPRRRGQNKFSTGQMV